MPHCHVCDINWTFDCVVRARRIVMEDLRHPHNGAIDIFAGYHLANDLLLVGVIST